MPFPSRKGMLSARALGGLAKTMSRKRRKERKIFMPVSVPRESDKKCRKNCFDYFDFLLGHQVKKRFFFARRSFIYQENFICQDHYTQEQKTQ